MSSKCRFNSIKIGITDDKVVYSPPLASNVNWENCFSNLHVFSRVVHSLCGAGYPILVALE